MKTAFFQNVEIPYIETRRIDHDLDGQSFVLFALTYKGEIAGQHGEVKSSGQRLADSLNPLLDQKGTLKLADKSFDAFYLGHDASTSYYIVREVLGFEITFWFTLESPERISDALGGEWLASIRQFQKLLDTSEDERPLQRFFEEHPIFLVGPKGHFGLRYGTVVSQFPLGADFKTDFAYLYETTVSRCLVLLEIESPNCPIFTSKDEFSRQFNHAIQQLEDWSSWCKDNIPFLRDVFGLSSSSILTPVFRLVAGRRHQISNRRRKRRYAEKSKLLTREISYCTYDRLLEQIPRDLMGRSTPQIECASYKSQKFSEKKKQWQENLLPPF
jgi:hypothetical protein